MKIQNSPLATQTTNEAAKSLESYFVRKLLKEAKVFNEKGMASGNQVFGDMLTEALADAVTENHGLGLADVITRELQDQKTTPMEKSDF